MKNNSLLTIAAVALIASLIGGFTAGLVGNQSALFGATGTRMPNGISADSTSPIAGEVRSTTLTTTGAATISGAVTFGSTLNLPTGMNVIASSTPFTSATNTPASILNPFSATSTAVGYVCNQDTAGGNAATNVYEVALAYTRYATTTGIIGPTTLTGISSLTSTTTFAVGPNQWIVFKNASSSVGTNSPTGACGALFISN